MSDLKSFRNDLSTWLQHTRDSKALHVMVPCAAIERVIGILDTLPKAMDFPRQCELCNKQIESKDDLDWHGLGNCVNICRHCEGSGIEPEIEA